MDVTFVRFRRAIQTYASSCEAPAAILACALLLGIAGCAAGKQALPPPMPTTGAQLIPLQFENPPFNTEAYDFIQDNSFEAVAQKSLSTFAIDVDTASYANVRRILRSGIRPPRDAVRIEEMLNYFKYGYAPPSGDDPRPFAVHFEVAAAPWASEHRLVRIGLKGREVVRSERPPANLVFLIDVSGSMAPMNKLWLVKQSLRLLVDELDEKDRVAIVVYAGASGLTLPSTAVQDRQAIHTAIEQLEAGGSTNGGSGILLAFSQAVQHFIPGVLIECCWQPTATSMWG